jgi:hypothetical protein
LLPITQVGGAIEKTTQISNVVKQSLNAWTSKGGGKNIMQRFIEMKCLQEYASKSTYNICNKKKV